MTFVSNFEDGIGRVVTGGTLDAEVISDTMDIRKLHQLTFMIGLVRGGGATGVVMSLDCSIDGFDWKPVQNQAQTPPDKSLVDATWTKTTSVTADWAFDVAENGRLGGPFLRARFNGVGSPTIADVLTVDAYGEL